VSAQRGGLLPISQQSLFVLSSLGYHDYEGLALNDEEKPRLVADLGKKTFLILRNHGLLPVGPTVADAFLSMFLLQRACRIQIMAQSGGVELVPIDPKVFAQIPAQEAVVTQGGGGRLVWPGLLRKLDRMGANYKD
jgi:ribulose-5-phosphate 4-epimerase/fuculose-1-phosphate aldolase